MGRDEVADGRRQVTQRGGDKSLQGVSKAGLSVHCFVNKTESPRSTRPLSNYPAAVHACDPKNPGREGLLLVTVGRNGPDLRQ